jgi:hypothetical protein
VTLVQFTAHEANRCAQLEISKSVNPFTFCFRIRKWEYVTVDEIYMILAVFMLMGIVVNPTLISYYSKNWVLLAGFFFHETLPL